MALDGVPFAIDQSALHDATSARTVNYAAFNGTEGVVSPRDLLVLAQAVPDNTVQILPGVGVCLNRALNQTHQAYTFRNPIADSLTISPNNTASPRTDMVIARVENPYLGGEPWSVPADPAAGPYVFFRVIENVSATANTLQEVDSTMSGIALARITVPAMTSTITGADITSLRVLNSALTKTDENGFTISDMQVLANTQTTYVHYPTTVSGWLVVPEWATHISIYATFDPAMVFNGATPGVHANWRWNLNNGEVLTNPVDFDANAVTSWQSGVPWQGDYRVYKTYYDRIEIPDAWKGDNIPFHPEMKMDKTFVNHTDNMRCNRGTNLFVQFIYRQTALGA